MALASPRLTGRSYPVPDIDFPGKPEEWIRRNSQILAGVMDGKINATGSVTLTDLQATTTLADRRIGPNSDVTFNPLTSNAALEQGAGTMYTSARGKETLTITHANNAQTDRTFSYSILG